MSEPKSAIVRYSTTLGSVIAGFYCSYKTTFQMRTNQTKPKMDGLIQ